MRRYIIELYFGEHGYYREWVEFCGVYAPNIMVAMIFAGEALCRCNISYAAINAYEVY